MALWKKVQCLPTETLNSLYPPTFPIEVRHYLASWLEEQPWDDLDLMDPTTEGKALILLSHIMNQLRRLAEHNHNIVERMRLQHIATNMTVYQMQPLQLVRAVQEILKRERSLLNQGNFPGLGVPGQLPQAGSPALSPAPSPLPAPSTAGGKQGDDRERHRAIERLALRVGEVQNCRKEIHHLQESMNWEKQNYDSLQAQAIQNSMLDQNLPESCNNLQNRIQQDEFKSQAFAEKRIQLIQEAVHTLEQTQQQVELHIQSWKRQQHLSTIGAPFSDNLSSLQNCCEQLLTINIQLNQEMIIAGRESGAQPFREQQEKLALLLKTLIQSALLVDKQPPQVIKTQSKFSTTVRFLLGERMNSGKPAVVKAQIITESQARNLSQPGSLTENVGELINNSAILDHNASTKSTSSTFRNMSIKRIKRADRKGSESVTEEKFALLFSSEINITGCDTAYNIQVISFPIVVIVHGSQDNNALATILWDCAFSEMDRIPFVVPDRVSWQQMCDTLNTKFMSEVQTPRRLDNDNFRFLAQKIFDEPDISGDFQNRMVSWSQFNKEVLPGRGFTFWQWFDGVMELTKRHLKNYWTDRLIFGFIGKQYLHLLLQQSEDGTFLLRFSDSEIGGITIAYVTTTDTGSRQILNIQPFTKKDLEIRSLGDRIQDITFIQFVYPNRAKNEAFNKYYTVMPNKNNGYLQATIHTKVAGEQSSSRMGNGGGAPSTPSPLPSDLDHQTQMNLQTPFNTARPFNPPAFNREPISSRMGNGGVSSAPSPLPSETPMEPPTQMNLAQINDIFFTHPGQFQHPFVNPMLYNQLPYPGGPQQDVHMQNNPPMQGVLEPFPEQGQAGAHYHLDLPPPTDWEFVELLGGDASRMDTDNFQLPQ